MFVILYIMIAGTVDSFVEGLGITLCCCCFDHRHGVAVLGVLTTVLASVRFGIARTICKAIFVPITFTKRSIFHVGHRQRYTYQEFCPVKREVMRHML